MVSLLWSVPLGICTEYKTAHLILMIGLGWREGKKAPKTISKAHFVWYSHQLACRKNKPASKSQFQNCNWRFIGAFQIQSSKNPALKIIQQTKAKSHSKSTSLYELPHYFLLIKRPAFSIHSYYLLFLLKGPYNVPHNSIRFILKIRGQLWQNIVRSVHRNMK